MSIMYVCMHIYMRQVVTWDPSLQCLHMDKCLLEQENTKKLLGTKNSYVHTQLGQIIGKIRKDQKSNCHFWRAGSKKKKKKNRVSGAKAGHCPCTLHMAPPRGWTNPKPLLLSPHIRVGVGVYCAIYTMFRLCCRDKTALSWADRLNTG